MNKGRSTMVVALLGIGGCTKPPQAPAPSVAPESTAPEASTVAPGSGSDEQGDEIDRLVASLCDKQVVLLGEADHGEGRTWEIKTRIVDALVRSCGFGSVFIESGMYDFVALDHAYDEGTATFADMSSAIGALWSGAREMQPFITALHQGAEAGTLEVMGLDDQLHSTAWYAQRQLPAVLSAHLPGKRRQGCEVALARHTTWGYDQATPYTQEVNDELLACLEQIKGALESAAPSEPASEHLAMASSLHRYLSRAFGMDGRASFGARDASMFDNFQWHRGRLGPQAKSIVWCSTIHAAKTLDGLDAYRGIVPLGQRVHEHYGERAASIGFSAYSGASQPRGRPRRELDPAAPESLEGQVLAPEQELRYLDADALGELGPIEARPIGHELHRAQWQEILDGLVVLRREEPAHHEEPDSGG
ncbi:MAG: erythromycin esterase family protein [Nannocystaceae bacterium]